VISLESVAPATAILATVATPAPPIQSDFARLVSLACHDLRTPLATVFGFARTLARVQLTDPAPKYVSMIEASAAQLGELLDELSLAARIEAGRYEPALAPIDTLALARHAAAQLGEERVEIRGEGGSVNVDVAATERAVSALVQCALRHGGLEQVTVTADGAELLVEPVTHSSVPVLTGEQLRDLGAAVATRLLVTLGGSIAVEGERLRITLPAT
jgi:signal transduction histidine kinase